MSLFTRAVASALLLASALPDDARAQAKKVVNRAERLISPDATDADLQAAHRMLTDAILASPPSATPEGWWLRGVVAALLAERQPQELTLHRNALECFETAVRKGWDPPDRSAFQRLDEHLVQRANGWKGAEDPAVLHDAYLASELTLRAERTARVLGLSDPVERVRRLIVAVRATMASGRVDEARALFRELDHEGGFIESLALEVATGIERIESEDEALIFLGDLHERQPDRRALLVATLELADRSGQTEKGLSVLRASARHFDKTYEDHLLVADFSERFGDIPAAEARLREGIRLAPRGWDANYRLAALLIQRAADADDPTALLAEAEALLQRILEINPDNPDARRALASLRSPEPATEAPTP